jgi:hypothetical protein
MRDLEEKREKIIIPAVAIAELLIPLVQDPGTWRFKQE